MCNKKINIASRDNTPLYEVIQQVANLCKISMFVEDKVTLENLKKPYKTLYVKNGKFENVIKVLLNKNFFYSLENNILTISYLGTKIFKVNYPDKYEPEKYLYEVKPEIKKQKTGRKQQDKKADTKRNSKQSKIQTNNVDQIISHKNNEETEKIHKNKRKNSEKIQNIQKAICWIF